MSFILDALKKSEERRQQEEPTSSGKQVLHLGTSGTRRWPLWVVLALLPTALLAGWWLGRSPQAVSPPPTNQSVQTEPRHEAAMPVQPTTAARPATLVTPAVVPTQTQPKVSVVAHPAQPSSEGMTSAGDPQQVTTDLVAPVPVPVQAPIPTATEIREPARSAAKPEKLQGATSIPPAAPDARRLPVYADLPRDLRDRMPHLDISLHFYSENPTRRMARINGRLLHEGENVETDLVVHEITPTATVLDYQGLLFELGGPGG